MTRILNILLITFLTSNIWSQTDNIDSVRWIRIYDTPQNSLLFEYHGKNDSTLIGAVSKNAFNGEEIFFLESTNISDKSPKYFKLTKLPVVDSLDVDSCITFTWEVSQQQILNSIVYAYNDGNPLNNVFGEPIIVHYEGGALCFIYPPNTYTITPISEINELRIKEVRVFNEKNMEYEYVPIAIQITPQLVGKTGTETWLDLTKLKEKIINIENQGWYNFILNKKYVGMQYMQLKHSLYTK